jgi:hypothetical protein
MAGSRCPEVDLKREDREKLQNNGNSETVFMHISSRLSYKSRELSGPIRANISHLLDWSETHNRMHGLDLFSIQIASERSYDDSAEIVIPSSQHDGRRP